MTGAFPYFNDAVAGTVQQISGSRVLLTGLKLVNTTPATAYLQVFGKPSTSVNLGSDTPDFCIRLAANESVYLPISIPVQASGASGLSVAGTTTSTGSTGAAISVTAFYA